MNKGIVNFPKNQHSESNSFKGRSCSLPNRKMRRDKNYVSAARQGIDPWVLYEYIDEKRRQGKGLIHKLLNHLLILAYRGMYCYASIRWLGDFLGCHENSVSRLTKELAEYGLIRKCYRGMGKSVILILNKIFNNRIIQEVISPLFVFMYVGPIMFLIPTPMTAMSRLGLHTRSSISKLVNYNKECININYYSTKKRDILWKKEHHKADVQSLDSLLKRVAPNLTPKREEKVTITSAYDPPAWRISHQEWHEPLPEARRAPVSSTDPHWGQTTHWVHNIVKKKVAMNTIGHHYPELEQFHQLNMTSFGKFKLTVLPKDIVIKLYGALLHEGKFPSYERFFNRARLEAEKNKIDVAGRLKEFHALCKDMELDPNSPPAPEKKRSDEYLSFEKYLASPEGQKVQEKLGPLKNPFES